MPSAGAITELRAILWLSEVFNCFGQDVCDLNRSAVDDGTPCNEPTHKG